MGLAPGAGFLILHRVEGARTHQLGGLRVVAARRRGGCRTGLLLLRRERRRPGGDGLLRGRDERVDFRAVVPGRLDDRGRGDERFLRELLVLLRLGLELGGHGLDRLRLLAQPLDAAAGGVFERGESLLGLVGAVELVVAETVPCDRQVQLDQGLELFAELGVGRLGGLREGRLLLVPERRAEIARQVDLSHRRHPLRKRGARIAAVNAS